MLLLVGDPKKHSCKAEPIIYNATLRPGMHSGVFTKLGRVKTMDDCIERCCRSSNADVAYMLGPFCFAVKCRTREMCKPSPAMYSDISSLNLNPAISFLNKDKIMPLGLGMYIFSYFANLYESMDYERVKFIVSKSILSYFILTFLFTKTFLWIIYRSFKLNLSKWWWWWHR